MESRMKTDLGQLDVNAKTAKTAKTAQPNHLSIHKSINSIKSVVGQLIELKDELTGHGEAEDANKSPSLDPSFMDVLIHTSTNIQDECIKAENLIKEIREMLLN